jgi:hypothetical protein
MAGYGNQDGCVTRIWRRVKLQCHLPQETYRNCVVPFTKMPQWNTTISFNIIQASYHTGIFNLLKSMKQYRIAIYHELQVASIYYNGILKLRQWSFFLSVQ